MAKRFKLVIVDNQYQKADVVLGVLFVTTASKK